MMFALDGGVSHEHTTGKLIECHRVKYRDQLYYALKVW